MTANTTGEATIQPIVLPDGLVIPVRPIEPSDAPALQRFHRRLSQESIYLRHFGSVPELSEAQARYFTHLDGVNRFALVALHPEQPSEIIAVVRYDREPGTATAEYAALVEDRWQGRGIGMGLTRRLIEAARQRGIERFYALVLPENVRMRALLEDLGLPERVRWADGVARIEVELLPEQPVNPS